MKESALSDQKLLPVSYHNTSLRNTAQTASRKVVNVCGDAVFGRVGSRYRRWVAILIIKQAEMVEDGPVALHFNRLADAYAEPSVGDPYDDFVVGIEP